MRKAAQLNPVSPRTTESTRRRNSLPRRFPVASFSVAVVGDRCNDRPPQTETRSLAAI